MPRKKWVNKCSYCRGSKLTDEIFEDVLRCFVMGTAAETARAEMVERAPTRNTPSGKTIRRHYRQIGNALCEAEIAPLLLSLPEIEEAKRISPEHYEVLVHSFVENFHKMVMGGEASNLTDDRLRRVAEIYQQYSASKKGIKGSIREHLGMAGLLSKFDLYKADRTRPGVQYGEDVRPLVFDYLKEFFKEWPC